MILLLLGCCESCWEKFPFYDSELSIEELPREQEIKWTDVTFACSREGIVFNAVCISSLYFIVPWTTLSPSIYLHASTSWCMVQTLKNKIKWINSFTVQEAECISKRGKLLPLLHQGRNFLSLHWIVVFFITMEITPNQDCLGRTGSFINWRFINQSLLSPVAIEL